MLRTRAIGGCLISARAAGTRCGCRSYGAYTPMPMTAIATDANARETLCHASHILIDQWDDATDRVVLVI